MTLKKPARGSAAAAKRARRRAIERAEKAAKDAARIRDGYACRRCLRRAHAINMVESVTYGIEAAHLIDKQSGGDHGRYSSEARHFVMLCAECHRGPRGVHAGFVRMEFGPEGGDGHVQFLDQRPGDRHKGAA